jgi:nicotinamide mononucleotide adenylyltransferase
MRVVIGSGRNRHVFDVPRDTRERQSMIDEVLSMLFRSK